MDLPFELHIALRYLLAKRKQAFISVISLISTLGVTVGVMAVIVALAIMTGLQQELRDRIVGSNPHIYVWNRDGISDYRAEVAKLRNVPHVIGAAPAILGRALISAQNNREAAAAQAELQKIFENAGWPVAIERAPYPVKAGIFMLAGDETPPKFVDTVSDAFDAGGVEVQYLTGYRDFYKGRQKENPKWVGPTLADDQPFTIVIGSKPQPKVAE